MHLFGRRNWWLPSWLDRWLPHLSVEPDEPDDAEPAVELEDPAAAPVEAPQV